MKGLNHTGVDLVKAWGLAGLCEDEILCAITRTYNRINTSRESTGHHYKKYSVQLEEDSEDRIEIVLDKDNTLKKIVLEGTDLNDPRLTRLNRTIESLKDPQCSSDKWQTKLCFMSCKVTGYFECPWFVIHPVDDSEKQGTDELWVSQSYPFILRLKVNLLDVGGMNSPEFYINLARIDFQFRRAMLFLSAVSFDEIKILSPFIERVWVQNNELGTVLLPTGYWLEKDYSVYDYKRKSMPLLLVNTGYFNGEWKASILEKNVFALPDCIDEIVKIFGSLTFRDQKKVLVFGRWHQIAGMNRAISLSSSYGALINSIDSLRVGFDIPKEHDTMTKQFKYMVKVLAPSAEENPLIEELFFIRSKIFHFGYMMKGDLDPAEFLNAKNIHDETNYKFTRELSKVMLVNWLLRMKGLTHKGSSL